MSVNHATYTLPALDEMLSDLTGIPRLAIRARWGTLLRWCQQFGVNHQHFHVVQQVLARRDTLWRQLQAVQREGQEEVQRLATVAARATGPARQQALQAVEAAQTKLNGDRIWLLGEIRGVTVESVVKNRNLPKWTAEDTQKAKDLGQAIFARMRQLFPPGSEGYRPFYYPEFDSAAIRNLFAKCR